MLFHSYQIWKHSTLRFQSIDIKWGRIPRKYKKQKYELEKHLRHHTLAVEMELENILPDILLAVGDKRISF